MAGNSVWSNASCHSASVVSTMVGAAREADVVDEDVEAAEGLDGPGDHGLHALGRRQVGRDGQHAIGVARQRSRSSPPLRRAALRPRAQIVTRQPSSTSAGRDGQPEAAARAGDDGDLVGELRSMSCDCRPRSPACLRPVRSFRRPVERLICRPVNVFFARKSRSVVRSFGWTKASTARSIGLRVGERGRRLVGVGGDEFLLAPREDRADLHLVLGRRRSARTARG